MDIQKLYNAEAIYTVFSQAVQRFNRSFAFRAMLDTGLNPNLRNREGETLLHRAVFHNELEAAALLLAYGADPNARSGQSWTPAHVAALRDQKDMLALLAENNADLSLTDFNGWPANRPHSDYYQPFGMPPHGCGYALRAAAGYQPTRLVFPLKNIGLDMKGLPTIAGRFSPWPVFFFIEGLR